MGFNPDETKITKTNVKEASLHDTNNCHQIDLYTSALNCNRTPIFG